MKLSTVLFFLSLLLSCSTPLNAQLELGTDQKQTSTLKPFEAPIGELPQLGEPVQIAGYKISPPKDYGKQEPASPAGVKAVGWTGEARADGTSPMIQLMILTPPIEEELPKLEIAISKMLAGVKRQRLNWTESETSYGLIGGIKFAKKTWTGKEPNSGNDMLGTMYVGLDGGSLISLHTQDMQSYAESVKLGETSLLSLTK